MQVDPPLMAGMALALICGPLGCFVVWRRMAYFGDGLAHSGLLGVALAFLLGLSHQLGILLVGVLFAILLSWLQARKLLSTDTLVGIAAHATLSFGVIAMLLLGSSQTDIHALLLGKINDISQTNATVLAVGTAGALAVIAFFWDRLILTTMSEDIARAEGLSVSTYNFILMLLMALTVALSIQMVGVLLITSLLILPAACARLFAKSPEQMAVSAILIAAIGIFVGLQASDMFADNMLAHAEHYDAGEHAGEDDKDGHAINEHNRHHHPPAIAGPLIVAILTILFFVSAILRILMKPRGA